MRKYLSFILLFLFACAPRPSFAQDRSDKVRAVFLFKFAAYVTWPHGKSGSDLTLCTYGGDPFEGILDTLGRLQKDAPSVRHIKSRKGIAGCDLLYVEDADDLSLVGEAPILTVSSERDFAKEGGMIEMRQTSGKIKLVVNLTSLKAANLKASSRFLDVAEVIR